MSYFILVRAPWGLTAVTEEDNTDKIVEYDKVGDAFRAAGKHILCESMPYQVVSTKV